MESLQALTQSELNITKNGERSKPPARKCPHCDKVLEPKRLELFGQIRWGAVTCRCETQAREAEEREKEKGEWLKLCSEFTSKDKLIRGATLQNYQERKGCVNAYKIACNFLGTYGEWERDKAGLGIYFYGKNGLGKSHLLTALYQEFVKQGKAVVFMTTYHMFQRFREVAKTEDYAYERRLLKVLYNSDVLFLDDVGGEVPYDSRAEKLLDVITSRSRKRPIIYSSNYSLEELEQWFGNRSDQLQTQGLRISDRILENAVPVTLDAESQRGIINDQHIDWLEGRLSGLES
ncbi:ATP-binding protein [Brevibacillus laterosporus]|uniref:ATP-binding protein n=1 Tax=Brevibacillus laterosporus TaxID=1465 RepID=UPI003D21C751